MIQLILGCAYKYIQSPVLLFQSDQEKMVSTSAQEKFVLRVNNAGHTTAELIRVHPSKHEIYFSEDEVMKAYINEITDFLYHENHL